MGRRSAAGTKFFKNSSAHKRGTMDTTKITFTSNNAYGTSVAQAVVEGNPYAPLVVESEAREQASIKEKLTELVGELRVGKSLVFLGLVFTILLCAVTFGVVCFALEYSKETYVMEGALTDRATNQVVSTRVHEEVIENPLHADYAMGVQWITIMHSDGGMSRRRVNGYQRTKCIVQDENCLHPRFRGGRPKGSGQRPSPGRYVDWLRPSNQGLDSNQGYDLDGRLQPY